VTFLIKEDIEFPQMITAKQMTRNV
jgi:hypothetical protein